MRLPSGAFYEGPDPRTEIELLVRAYVQSGMPGKRILTHARGRLGIYQPPVMTDIGLIPGWKRLAPSTLRRKRRRLMRMRHRLPFERWGGFATSGSMADAPLIDTGQMAARMNQYARGNSAFVTAPFPAERHEQDPDMPIMQQVDHPLPQRAFMVPALYECLDPITNEVIDYVCARF